MHDISGNELSWCCRVLQRQPALLVALAAVSCFSTCCAEVEVAVPPPSSMTSTAASNMSSLSPHAQLVGAILEDSTGVSLTSCIFGAIFGTATVILVVVAVVMYRRKQSDCIQEIVPQVYSAEGSLDITDATPAFRAGQPVDAVTAAFRLWLAEHRLTLVEPPQGSLALGDIVIHSTDSESNENITVAQDGFAKSH